MTANAVVLEQWRKGGFTNRLVTDGKTIHMEYRVYGGTGWFVDHSSDSNQERFLKVFK